MNSPHRLKLFILMVLELFIWGAWFPVVYGYLGNLSFSATEKTWIMNAFTIASFTAMFFSAPFADRRFSAEKFLAVSHLIAGVAMIAMAWTRDFWTFFTLLLVHSMFYVPTLSVANSVAFTHLKDPQKEFGVIRMGGTVGWILAAWPLTFLLQGKVGAEAIEAKSMVFVVAGVASLVLAAFSWTLPHTPPKSADGAQTTPWLQAVSLLKVPFILVLFLVTFVDAGVHQCYFLWTDSYLTSAVGLDQKWVMPVMSLGQIAEIGTMLILGLVLKRLGWRKTMTLGVLGHAVRFAVFAWFPQHEWLIIAANLLHGVCYAFFFATIYIFVDEFFPKNIRATAQGLFNFLILGFGPFVANLVGPWLGEKLTDDAGVVHYDQLFLYPAGVALLASIVMFFLFRPPAKANATETLP